MPAHSTESSEYDNDDTPYLHEPSSSGSYEDDLYNDIDAPGSANAFIHNKINLFISLCLITMSAMHFVE